MAKITPMKEFTATDKSQNFIMLVRKASACFGRVLFLVKSDWLPVFRVLFLAESGRLRVSQGLFLVESS